MAGYPFTVSLAFVQFLSVFPLPPRVLWKCTSAEHQDMAIPHGTAWDLLCPLPLRCVRAVVNVTP